MKKIICLMICVVLIFCTCVITSAESTTEYLFEDRFIDEYVKEGVLYNYKEVYYHYDNSNRIEWCLINATASNKAACMVVDLKLDDFVICSNNIIYPFDLKYAIYDVKKDKFVDLVDNYDELSEYDGLFDVLRTLDESFIIGDADRDGELSVLDATAIQMSLAGKIDLNIRPYTDRLTHKYSNYYDVDDDGEFSVMDATAIQIKLAKK